MATVELTLDQIVGAVEQLSLKEREELQRRIASLETSSGAAKQRPMGRRQKKRMSELLLKANAGPLTSEEDTELNALVGEFESLTLHNAQALLQQEERPASRRRPSSKR